MWIQYKVGRKETLAKIVKTLRIKDVNIILKHPKNKKAVSGVKLSDELKPGTVLTVPNPKTKVYVVKDKKGKPIVLEQKDFKKYEKTVHGKMDDLCDSLLRRYQIVNGRHSLQTGVNSTHWVVHTFASAFSLSDEPKSVARAAETACANLQSTVRSRKYALFESDTGKCEKAIQKYEIELGKWISSLTGNAEKLDMGLTVAKTAGEICAAMLGVIYIAPVGLTGLAIASAISGGGAAMVYSTAGEAGKAFSRDKGISSVSEKKIVVDTITAAVTSGLVALMTGFIMLAVGAKLAGKALSHPKVVKGAQKLASSPFFKKIFENEAKVASKATQSSEFPVGPEFFLENIATLQQVVVVSITDYLLSASGAIATAFADADAFKKAVETWLEKNVDFLAKSKNQNAVIAKATADLSEAKADFITDFINKNKNAIADRARPALREAMKAEAKKNAPKGKK